MKDGPDCSLGLLAARGEHVCARHTPNVRPLSGKVGRRCAPLCRNTPQRHVYARGSEYPSIQVSKDPLGSSKTGDLQIHMCFTNVPSRPSPSGGLGGALKASQNSRCFADFGIDLAISCVCTGVFHSGCPKSILEADFCHMFAIVLHLFVLLAFFL